MTTKERLQQFIDLKSISNRKFCTEISVSHTYFSVKGAVSSDILAKIFAIYPELNMDWVITGRGQMINQLEGNLDVYKEKYLAILEKYNDCLESRVDDKKKPVPVNVKPTKLN